MIGAVLVPGGRAPIVVSEDMVRAMKPGAVIVDIAIDQGGCIETSHETTHSDPVFEAPRRRALRGRQHARARCRTPRPTRSPTRRCRTSPSWPASGPPRPCRRDPALALGLNTAGGHVVNAAVAEALGLPAFDLHEALAQG